MSDSEFKATLASRFSTIGDVSRLAHDEPLTAFSRSDLASVVGRPSLDFPLRPLPFEPPVRIPPLTPAEADIFIGTVSQTPEQAIAAAVHAARTAFEAIPTAQNGDVIDASIPNGFRSAMITLLSLADATVQQIVRQQPPRPIPPRPDPRPPRPLPDPLPPRPDPGPITPRPFPPIEVIPPTGLDPGVIRIDPSVLEPVRPEPAPGVTRPDLDTGGLVRELPAIDLGGRVFEATTVTHPETRAVTTVFVERPATGAATTALAPVAGGGFHLTGLGGRPEIG